MVRISFAGATHERLRSDAEQRRGDRQNGQWQLRAASKGAAEARFSRHGTQLFRLDRLRIQAGDVNAGRVGMDQTLSLKIQADGNKSIESQRTAA
jgi:hypothetical protein